MRHLCSAAIVASSIAATSQARAEAESYEPLRFDAGIAGSYIDASARSGTGFVGEIKYLLHDNVGIGARLDFQVMFGGQLADNVDLDIAMTGAALAKAEYYVGNGPIRPWAGGGLGFYSISSQTFLDDPEIRIETQQGKYFGIAPQVGIDLGRLRLAATYNLVFGAGIEVTRTINGVAQRTTYSQNYVTFELSFRIGGERKYKPAPFTPMAPYQPPAPYPPAPYPPPPVP
jgi:hypothetical protein